MMRGAHTASGLLTELMTLRGIHAGAVNEKLQTVGRIHTAEACKGLSPVEVTPRPSRGRSFPVL